MTRYSAMLGLIILFPIASCKRTEVIVAPQGQWRARQITEKPSFTCRFPWVFDVAYEKNGSPGQIPPQGGHGIITYSGPTVQPSPWQATFSHLDTNKPKVIQSDVRGAHEIAGFQGLHGDGKISLVKLSSEGVSTYTIDLKTGIAMFSEHTSFFMAPLMNAAMGTCQ